MEIEPHLRRARVVLKDTTHPGNIGSAARAMKSMGVQSLFLAAPKTLIDSHSRALAAGALDVLAAAVLTDTLSEALADCTQVVAFTARRRDFAPPALAVDGAMQKASRWLRQGGTVALLFGGERSGLCNEDIRQATAIAEIPAHPDYQSLNLAQAVQIAVYELRRALPMQTPPPPRRMPDQLQLAALMRHLQQTLRAVGLPKANDHRPLQARLRRLFARAEPDLTETKMLRGVFSAIVKAAKTKDDA